MTLQSTIAYKDMEDGFSISLSHTVYDPFKAMPVGVSAFSRYKDRLNIYKRQK